MNKEIVVCKEEDETLVSILERATIRADNILDELNEFRLTLLEKHLEDVDET